MVRFSCFSTPSPYQRPKKVQHLGGNMQSPSSQNSKDQDRKVNFDFAVTTQKAEDNNLSNSSVEQTTSLSSHGDWKSEYLNGDVHMEDNEFLQPARIKKSKSLGSILVNERGGSGGDFADDDEVDQQISFNYSREKGVERINDLLDGSTSPELYNHGILKIDFDGQHHENDLVEPFDMIADDAHHDSLFSIEKCDINQHISVDEQLTDFIAGSGCLSSDNHLVFARSHSANNLGADTDKSAECVKANKMRLRSRSFGNLRSVSRETGKIYDGELSPGMTDIGLKAASNSYILLQESDEDRKDLHCQVGSGEEHLSDTSGERELGDRCWTEKFGHDNQTTIIDRCHSRHHDTSMIERRETEANAEKIKNLHMESPILDCHELNPKELNIKRIEEWISQIDLENGNIIEEPGESSCPSSSQEPQFEVSVPPLKPDAIGNIGMEVAYNYISSLTATSSSAQMVNLGLVAIPFLSAYSSLKVLNLSGNSIVRITAGSLPKGLHMLNLSKNNIATIEGLRDLTRLRILDMSYNRIIRIGHGLATCSSLKELYLAGNRISEVDGLHRLLKLNTLDLRGNKISTAKGLGQLAANYGSLQAINLEGNPAQRLVGDDQLKKYLLSLLPKIVYYNKQAIRASGTKEMSDRPSRSVTKAEHKLPRRGSHGSGLHKAALSHIRSSHALGPPPKQHRSRNVENRHVRLPSMGSKPSNYLPETDQKQVSLQVSTPIRRIQSESAL